MEYDHDADPDYEEGGQGEFADAGEEAPSQEWYAQAEVTRWYREKALDLGWSGAFLLLRITVYKFLGWVLILYLHNK